MKKRPLPPPPSYHLLSPVETALEFWERVGNVAELWWSRHGGLPSGDIGAHRLQSLLAFARRASPFYKQRYAKLAREPRLTDLPPVTKCELMDNFEDSCTDSRVRLKDVERFLADRSRIGANLLGSYHAW